MRRLCLDHNTEQLSTVPPVFSSHFFLPCCSLTTALNPFIHSFDNPFVHSARTWSAIDRFRRPALRRTTVAGMTMRAVAMQRTRSRPLGGSMPVSPRGVPYKRGRATSHIFQFIDLRYYSIKTASFVATKVAQRRGLPRMCPESGSEGAKDEGKRWHQFVLH